MLSRKLQEPVAPYVSNVYNSLCTIVQAFPLAVLFWLVVDGGEGASTFKRVRPLLKWGLEFRELFYFPFLEISKMLLVFMLMTLIWHRYVTDNQFVSWRITWIDTVIPFIFAVIQCFAALSIKASSVAWFLGWFFAAALGGCAAYWQLWGPFNTRVSRDIYADHFKEADWERVYSTIRRYLEYSRRLSQNSAGAMLIALMFVLPYPCKDQNVAGYNYIDTAIVFIVCVWVMAAYYARGVNYFLRKEFGPCVIPRRRDTSPWGENAASGRRGAVPQRRRAHLRAVTEFAGKTGPAWIEDLEPELSKLPKGTVVAINCVTGEYVTGRGLSEASDAFEARFGKTVGWMHEIGGGFFVGLV